MKNILDTRKIFTENVYKFIYTSTSVDLFEVMLSGMLKRCPLTILESSGTDSNPVRGGRNLFYSGTRNESRPILVRTVS